MGPLEIILLFIGLTAMILGFVLPVKQGESTEEMKKMAKSEMKELVAREMQGIQTHVDEVIEEAITEAVEKTERSLDRLTNEKIMAVNEYSDTVLQEINRNHNEVMFLYDMLNDKHKNIKNTVQEVNKTVKEAAETQKEAQELVSNFQLLTPEVAEVSVPKKRNAKETVSSAPKEPEEEKVPEMESADSAGSVLNSNEKILELHEQGMDKVDIARHLGLGVGEVKLVIDLFKNI